MNKESMGMSPSRVQGEQLGGKEGPQELKNEVPELFDFDNISEIIGAKINDSQIVNFATKKDGSLEKYLVRYQTDKKAYYLTRNTNYQMKPAFKNLQVLHQHLPEKTIPKPIAYQEGIDALIYEELPGEILLPKLEGMSEEERIAHFEKVGNTLSQLQQIKVNSIDPDANKYNSSLENIMNSVNKDTFARVEKENPEIHSKLKELYDIIAEHENRLIENSELSVNHGDFHPKNIIVTEEDEIGLTDFTDITIAPKARDIGGFLEQTDSMMRFEGLADEEQIQEYQQAFVKGYGNDLNIEDNEVVFYRAWQAWRNAMYNCAKKEPDYEEATIALEKSRKYLESLELI